MNLVLETSKVEIEDTKQTLKAYQDSNTDSGNAITVSLSGLIVTVVSVADVFASDASAARVEGLSLPA